MVVLAIGYFKGFPVQREHVGDSSGDGPTTSRISDSVGSGYGVIGGSMSLPILSLQCYPSLL